MKSSLIKINLLLAITGFIFLTRCNDIFETDLEFKSVTLLGPADSLHSNLGTFTFWWDEVDGALMYNLQIVSPSFEKVGNLVIDTIVSTNKFTFPLTPGTYEWRLCALNSSSSTHFKTYTLFVDLSAAFIFSQPDLKINNLQSNIYSRLVSVKDVTLSEGFLYQKMRTLSNKMGMGYD
jgi:hypothetical protein